MVARRDLGMEIPIEKIFYAQKVMIYKCNAQGKPVVTATQMLESMIKSPQPTGTEATDVANAVLDGTDYVMLSGEMAEGAYPELAVQTMARICMEAESYLDYDAVFRGITAATRLPLSPLESLCFIGSSDRELCEGCSYFGVDKRRATTKLVAKYRPAMPILSVVVPDITIKADSFDWHCGDDAPAKHSLIYRGLIPVLSAGSVKASHSEAAQETLDFALHHAKVMELCKPGDSIVALHRIGAASVVKLLIAK